MKRLEDGVGETLDYLEYGNAFFEATPKPWSMKEIIDKLHFIKIKTFRSEKQV